MKLGGDDQRNGRAGRLADDVPRSVAQIGLAFSDAEAPPGRSMERGLRFVSLRRERWVHQTDTKSELNRDYPNASYTQLAVKSPG